MRTQKITLTENQLRGIITEVVKQVLKYPLNEISIKDKYDMETKNGKNKLPFDLYCQLCELDPTTTPQKVGKYANWILAKYTPGTDFDNLRVALKWYGDGVNRNIISRLNISPDINSFGSYDDLINTINSIKASDGTKISNSEYNNRLKLEGQFDILGSNDTFEIIEPYTFKAERYFGSGTNWCTVANEKYFNDYIENGTLFIVYPKNGDKTMKMQFYFENEEFADYVNDISDTPLECIEHVVTNEREFKSLLSLCKKTWADNGRLFMTIDDVLVDIKRRLADGEDPKNIFDRVYDFNEYGVAKVILKSKFNIINTNNEILCDEWFYCIDDFNEYGVAVVELNNKNNLINTKGEILCNKMYDWIGEFDENGVAAVGLGGNKYHIDIKGKMLKKRKK